VRNLRREFAVAVSAGEPLVRVDTDDVADCLATVLDVCRRYGWEVRFYDPLVGVRWLNGRPPEEEAVKPAGGKGGKPAGAGPLNVLAALEPDGGPGSVPTPVQVLRDFWAEPARPDKDHPGEVLPVVLVVANLHLAFEFNRSLLCALAQHLATDRVGDNAAYRSLRQKLYDPYGIGPEAQTGKFLVGMMPSEARLPPEVSPLFKHLVHELPDEDELGAILDGVLPVGPDGEPEVRLDPAVRKKACRFALGLTRLQAEGVFSASLVLHKTVDPSFVWKEKAKVLNKEGLVDVYQGTETFADVAGLDGLKDFVNRLLTPDELDDADPDVRARGVLVCGPPGTGKSLVAKAAGNQFGLPVLMVNPGNWMGSYVGESEMKTRKGFQIIRAHAPCVAVIDEVEKVMPSSRASQGDSGVGARMEGNFLTALNDIREPVFWVFTANDVRRMHEAFFRAERVDGVFYVRLPGPAQRASVWRLYGKKYFPKEVTLGPGRTVPFPRHQSTDPQEVLDALAAARPDRKDEAVWAERFTLPLMCVPAGPERDAWLARLRAVNPRVAAAVRLVDDEGWSPAEIRACCRLSRRLREPLTRTQTRIRPVSVSAAKVIAGLEEWAAESALDAETGELYRPAAADAPADPAPAAPSGGKARRRVRGVKDGDE